MTKSTEWQRIGEVPVDTGRLALVDPMNYDDVSHREDELVRSLEDEDPDSAFMTYELVTNHHGVAVALVFSTGLGDGSTRSRRVSRRPRGPCGSPRYGSGSCLTR